jgi:hypothetical protein
MAGSLTLAETKMLTNGNSFYEILSIARKSHRNATETRHALQGLQIEPLEVWLGYNAGISEKLLKNHGWEPRISWRFPVKPSV